MAKDPHMERRLLNWQRWKEGAGDIGLGYGNASMWNQVKVDVTPNRESVIPTNAIEAEETDRAVDALPLYLRDTVFTHYLSNVTIEVQAQRLGCGVSTVHSRIADAHRKLLVWFSDKTRRAAELRQQAEAVQEAARLVRLGSAAAIQLTKRGKVRKVKTARK